MHFGYAMKIDNTEVVEQMTLEFKNEYKYIKININY